MDWEHNLLVEKIAEALSSLPLYEASQEQAALAETETGAGPKRALTLDGKTSSRIATELVEEALRNGLTLTDPAPSMRELAGGNTSLQVSVASAPVNFVFKMDSSAKLAREARTIEDLRRDERLGKFCSRLPKIYAEHSDGAPYAYLMEWFDPNIYPSLKQIFFGPDPPPQSTHAVELVEHTLEALAEAFVGSRDERLQVRMMGEAYFARIEENLKKASEISPDFMSTPLEINGRSTRSWRDLLGLIRTREQKLQCLAPPFMTVVHGDPNPGNVLVKRSGPAIRDVKFIDLKDWKYGDYLFDIAKLSHFLLFTGPLEELNAFREGLFERSPQGMHIQYERQVPEYVQDAVQAIERRTREIAEDLRDPTWQLRYKLAMASNLLGLIPGRIKIAYVSQARILYAEGMLLLEDFLKSWTE